MKSAGRATFSVYHCPDCDFRFPARSGEPAARVCPHCGAPTREAARHAPHRSASPAAHPALHLEAVLDNLRSAWNVGSIFRVADGAGVRQLHLCGTTPRGDHPRVAKTALGAEESIPWSSHHNGLRLVTSLRGEGYHLWALETTPRAQPLFPLSLFPEETPLALVVGNEISGIDPDILAVCHRHVYLPMQGRKESLNVAVAFGIAAYALLHAR